MKREILCTPCAKRMEASQGDGSQYPGEYIKYVHGKAKHNPYVEGGESVCDSCMEPLPPGSDCCAVTIWADYSPNPYYPWEHELITTEEITQ